jgi:TolB-like protein/Tfp pilus assembly protein PilF/DNA-binding winged helix-turn-helix (wHTH) protein
MREGFRLGDLIVAPDAGFVLRPDGRDRLRPRAIAVLLPLAERHGQTVSREELRARLLSDGSGSDAALVRGIGELRHALGDSAQRERYVQTVGRQGYRLVGEPQSLTDDERLQVRRERNRDEGHGSWWSRVRRGPRLRRTLTALAAYGGLNFGLLLPGLQLVVQGFALPPKIVNVAVVIALVGFLPVGAWAWNRHPAAAGATPELRPRYLIGGGALLIVLVYLLARLANPPPPPPQQPVTDRSIVVLPFTNMSDSPSGEHLGDGLAEEIANRLTRVPGLAVASRTAAFAYKNRKDAKPKQISAEIGVRYVLEGSVRRSGDDMRVTAQLVDGPSERHLWSKTYQRRGVRDFDIEDDIAGAVMEGLRIVLSPEKLERLRERPTASYDAYERYRQGISELRDSASPESLARAKAAFDAALRIDPTFAEAHAALCETGVKRYTYIREPGALRDAQHACEQALRLDRGVPEVHLAYGLLYKASGQQGEAERQFRAAIAIKPELVEARLGLAASLAAQKRVDDAEAEYRSALAARPRYWMVYDRYGAFLLARGRAVEATAQYRRAAELAPDNSIVHSNLGASLFMQGRFADAAVAFQRSVELHPTAEGYSNTGTNYYYAGRYLEAVDMFSKATELAPKDYLLWGNLGDAQRYQGADEALASQSYARSAQLSRAHLGLNPDDAAARGTLAYALARGGDPDAARQELEQIRLDGSTDYYAHYYVALVLNQLGEVDRAVDHLRAAVELGYPRPLLGAAAELDGLRSDPRVVAMMADKTGNASLPTASNAGEFDG